MCLKHSKVGRVMRQQIQPSLGTCVFHFIVPLSPTMMLPKQLSNVLREAADDDTVPQVPAPMQQTRTFQDPGLGLVLDIDSCCKN